MAATAHRHFSVLRSVLVVTLGSDGSPGGMVIMTRLIAPGVKRVFVGEAEGSVPHFMEGDLVCTVRQ